MMTLYIRTPGLTKMPYIRDGRRSVGIDDFVITCNSTCEEEGYPADCIGLFGHGV
jgi:hypothetical protein